MNINRDNYEMLLLLYVDNELSTAERLAVELFVAENPDLLEELMQLQNTVIPAERVMFMDKENLFRSEQVNRTLEEQLLLHLDGELDPATALSTTALIAYNDNLAAEWDLLRKTKLDATEFIPFPDKSLLYRNERNNVVIGRFVRWAVAATVLGAGIFIGLSIFNKVNTNGATTAANDKIRYTQPIEDSPASTGSQQMPMSNVNKGEAMASTIAPVITDQLQQTGRFQKTPTQHALAKNGVKKDKPGTAMLPGPGEAEPPLLAAKTQQRSVDRISPERTNEEMAIAKLSGRPAGDIVDTDLTPVDNTMARTAGIMDLENSTNLDRILYMNEDKITRSKAGGFLRKLKRTVERNAKLRTGNGLKIAGFEFAAK